jgi:hypothetical protein
MCLCGIVVMVPFAIMSIASEYTIHFLCFRCGLLPLRWLCCVRTMLCVVLWSLSGWLCWEDGLLICNMVLTASKFINMYLKFYQCLTPSMSIYMYN